MEKSERIYRKYPEALPWGGPANYRFESPYPMYFERFWLRLWDVDGKEFATT